MAPNKEENSDDVGAKKEEGGEESENDKFLWYFAIGSMMHPESMFHRNVIPMKSQAAELYDYKMNFFGKFGVAEAVPTEGESMHGVAHWIDEKTMHALDKIEMGYVRKAGRARLYDSGEVVDVTVYCRPTDEASLAKAKASPFMAEDCPPTERYLDILVLGAKHFGLEESYIQYLENHDYQPRPLPHQFKSFGPPPPDAPTMTLEQVQTFDGQEGRPLYITIHGKVLARRFQDGQSHLARNFYAQMTLRHGHCREIGMAKTFYDPKYAVPDSFDDFTQEHSAYLEHFLYHFAEMANDLGQWEVVAFFDQKYRE